MAIIACFMEVALLIQKLLVDELIHEIFNDTLTAAYITERRTVEQFKNDEMETCGMNRSWPN